MTLIRPVFLLTMTLTLLETPFGRTFWEVRSSMLNSLSLMAPKKLQNKTSRKWDRFNSESKMVHFTRVGITQEGEKLMASKVTKLVRNKSKKHGFVDLPTCLCSRSTESSMTKLNRKSSKITQSLILIKPSLSIFS